MQLNQASIDLIKKWEGCKLTAYLDIGKKLTVGVGHLVLPEDNIKLGDTITQEQADQLLLKDLVKSMKIVDDNIKVEINDNMYGALVSLTFNCGSSPLTGSVGAAINQSNLSDTAHAILLYCRYRNPMGQLVISTGLLNRRKAEVQMFQKPIDREFSEQEIEEINNQIKISLNQITESDLWVNNEE